MGPSGRDPTVVVAESPAESPPRRRPAWVRSTPPSSPSLPASHGSGTRTSLFWSIAALSTGCRPPLRPQPAHGGPDVGLVFFFSSRRRHTRYIGDWSSDVCSSD